MACWSLLLGCDMHIFRIYIYIFHQHIIFATCIYMFRKNVNILYSVIFQCTVVSSTVLYQLPTC